MFFIFGNFKCYYITVINHWYLSISVTCYDSIYVIFKLLPTYNIYRILTAPS